MDIAGEIERKLGERSPVRYLIPSRRTPAAVLIPVFEKANEGCFLLTRRTETVATHKGQISFPGGVREEGDSSLLETALREAEEEVGLQRNDVRMLGEFDDYFAVTNQLVRSFVGLIPPEYDFQLQVDEVDYLLEVPFDFFRTATPQIEKRMHRGKEVDVYHFDFDGEDIWGLTARIIRDFLTLLG